jgi:hypothetical protein
MEDLCAMTRKARGTISRIAIEAMLEKNKAAILEYRKKDVRVFQMRSGAE